MAVTDPIALLISLQERVNKVFDDIKKDREIDREQLNLLVDRVEKLELVGVEVKKHEVPNPSLMGGVMGAIQNPVVLAVALSAMVSVIAILMASGADLGLLTGKVIDRIGK